MDLLTEIPLLQEKTFCVDSARGRKLLNQLPYHIQAVPTLFVTDGINKILKVVEGATNIRNWFLLVQYSMSSAPPESSGPADEMMPEPLPAENNDSFTALSGDNYILKENRIENTRSTAEQLQREREAYLEQTAAPSMSRP